MNVSIVSTGKNRVRIALISVWVSLLFLLHGCCSTTEILCNDGVSITATLESGESFANEQYLLVWKTDSSSGQVDAEIAGAELRFYIPRENSEGELVSVDAESISLELRRNGETITEASNVVLAWETTVCNESSGPCADETVTNAEVKIVVP